jgi:hypothetical protein
MKHFDTGKIFVSMTLSPPSEFHWIRFMPQRINTKNPSYMRGFLIRVEGLEQADAKPMA